MQQPEQKNELPWPSMEQLPREVCHRINSFFAAADAAALAIQQAYRGSYKGGHAFRMHKRSKLHAWALASRVTAGEKYDGTNVGKMLDGTLLGRRFVIEDSAPTYQKCSLDKLRAYAADAVIQDLASAGNSSAATLRRGAVYGELCSLAWLYGYAAAGVAKQWFAFGALLEFADAAPAEAYAAAAEAAGLLCRFSGTATVHILNGGAFAAILERHGLPAVAAAEHGSLASAVASGRTWMLSELGEGIVLSIAGGHGGQAAAYKWKISREHQPTAIKELTALSAALSAGAGGKAALLDPEIREMVATLLEVATHVDSTVAAATRKAATWKAEPKASGLEPAAVQTALASALTKFDAIDAHLDAHGPAAFLPLCDRLVAEMLADADLNPPAEGAPGREAAKKELGAAVRKHVGQQVGIWKAKAKAAAGLV